MLKRGLEKRVHVKSSYINEVVVAGYRLQDSGTKSDMRLLRNL